MLGEIDKNELFSLLRERVAADLASATASQEESQAGATHDEARPESSKDTRAIESSYLARGLAARVSELKSAITRLDNFVWRAFSAEHAVAVGALVAVEDEGDSIECYFIAPAGGGIKLEVGGISISTITPSSPLGAALMKKHLDDDVELRTPRGQKSLTIVELR